MLITKRRGWEIPASTITPESHVVGRRATVAGALAMAAAPALLSRPAWAAPNPKYPAGRALTAEVDATTYNNFYEFSTDKDLWQLAKPMKTRPWTIAIDGLVSSKQTIGIDDLLGKMAQEERVYRHRCVETWAMTVPWTGFPLASLVALAQPLSSAKYMVFQTAQDPSMPGIRAPFYPWPYIEALTMAEATNELAFVATGLFGKPLPPQNGAPLRITLPWKYGFKSIKSIVKISFTETRPKTFWEQIQPSEYGFWANVNPKVPHPRWSQATERLLGSNERVPTQLFNGYADFVAPLYTNLQSERLFM